MFKRNKENRIKELELKMIIVNDRISNLFKNYKDLYLKYNELNKLMENE